MDILSYHKTPFTQEKIDLIRSSVPQEIRDMPCWCYYKSTFDKTKSKYIKRPCNFSGYPIDWRQTKNTFDDLAAKPNKYVTGVGIVLHPNCVVAWDIDHCLDNGKLHDDNIISDLTRINSYTEVSPSGTGLHILFKAEKPEWATMVKGGPYELYFEKHFITITGFVGKGISRPFRAVEIDDIKQIYQRIDPNVDFRTAADFGLSEEHFAMYLEAERKINEMLAKKHAKSTTASIQNSVGKKTYVVDTSEKSDDEVIAGMRSHMRSRMLLDGEWDTISDLSGRRLYPSQSEADLACCRFLAINSNFNYYQTDRIFRNTDLFREKWDRSVGNGKTYGQHTLMMAFNDHNEQIPKEMR